MPEVWGKWKTPTKKKKHWERGNTLGRIQTYSIFKTLAEWNRVKMIYHDPRGH
jgi:hypothetical protein